MKARFADVLLDTDAMHLERGGEAVHVEPQVLEVLAHLVQHHDRLVPKTELLDEIWGDRFVSESALSSRVKSARQAIGDNGRDQRLIKTVHGRGFRFVGEVQSAAPTTADHDGMASLIGLQPEDPPVPDELGDLARGGAAVVVGASATGRAATVDRLVRRLRVADLLVGHGTVADLRPLSGLRAALDDWLQHRPDLTASLPASCRVEVEAMLAGSPSTNRPRLFLACRELLAAAAVEPGAALVVEDVHLADHTTRDLLIHLARSAAALPAAIVVTSSDATAFAPWFTPLNADDADDADDDAGAAAADRLPPAARLPLASVAATGEAFRRGHLVAAADLSEEEADRVLDVAVAAGVLRRTDDGVRFEDAQVAAELANRLDATARAAANRAVAERLHQEGAPAELVARRLLDADDPDAAAPHLVEAATAASWSLQHAEVLELTAEVDRIGPSAERADLLELRADALAALADPEAIRRYREALQVADPDRIPWLRTRLARAHVFANDVEAAAEALEGVDAEGPTAAGTALVRGMVRYLQGDLDAAEALLDDARAQALLPGAPAQMLDAIALQGMIAHSRGEWFDRLRRELRSTAGSHELASTIFDSHVCVAQYLLYGPTGHAEVLRLAEELESSATSIGSPRAAGFATTLRGEASLLAGDLATARAALEASVALHRDAGADTGLAHALQRLAEVALAEGDRAEAERLCRESIPLARWSPLSQHLLQRSYGTLIAAAPDPAAAVRQAEEALAIIDGPTSCEFCHIMVALPAAMAFAQGGLLEAAHEQLEAAAHCANRWEGPAWPAAISEGRAVLAFAGGDHDAAAELFRDAAVGFDRAGQPLDAARCREAI